MRLYTVFLCMSACVFAHSSCLNWNRSCLLVEYVSCRKIKLKIIRITLRFVNILKASDEITLKEMKSLLVMENLIWGESFLLNVKIINSNQIYMIFIKIRKSCFPPHNKKVRTSIESHSVFLLFSFKRKRAIIYIKGK